MTKREKKIDKLINEVYKYSETLDVLPPRGDGAKFEVIKEIHSLIIELFNISERATEKENYKMQLMLLELVEQILIDKVDDELSVQDVINIVGEEYE